MKKILIITFLGLCMACSSDDDTSTRATEIIEITIDSNAPLPYSQQIDAQLVPLPQQTGFQSFFYIDSENTTGDDFHFELPKSIDSSYTAPFSWTLAHPIPLSQVFSITGIAIDDSNPGNSVFVQLQQFGNPGSQVKIQIDGFYYDFSNTMHTISISIDIIRDV